MIVSSCGQHEVPCMRR